MVEVLSCMGHYRKSISKFGKETGEVADPSLVLGKMSFIEAGRVVEHFGCEDGEAFRCLEIGAEVDTEGPVCAMVW
jgi:hypothetical protein